MPLAARLSTISPDDYLEYETDNPVKHEYLDGQVVATAAIDTREKWPAYRTLPAAQDSPLSGRSLRGCRGIGSRLIHPHR